MRMQAIVTERAWSAQIPVQIAAGESNLPPNIRPRLFHAPLRRRTIHATPMSGC
jgi:hypothetical protein